MRIWKRRIATTANSIQDGRFWDVHNTWNFIAMAVLLVALPNILRPFCGIPLQLLMEPRATLKCPPSMFIGLLARRLASWQICRGPAR